METRTKQLALQNIETAHRIVTDLQNMAESSAEVLKRFILHYAQAFPEDLCQDKDKQELFDIQNNLPEDSNQLVLEARNMRCPSSPIGTCVTLPAPLAGVCIFCG